MKFDVGHGGQSFVLRNAAPAIAQGFWPDTISTDLHAPQHECPDDGHADAALEIPGAGDAAQGRDPARDLESRAADPVIPSSDT